MHNVILAHHYPIPFVGLLCVLSAAVVLGVTVFMYYFLMALADDTVSHKSIIQKTFISFCVSVLVVVLAIRIIFFGGLM